ncbi:MAG: circadian clock KaiB family protein [Deltaproteobacteria bacterium]
MTALQRFEELAARGSQGKFRLKLFVIGMTEKSCRAVNNLKHVCDEKLKGRYELEVVDICQKPELTRSYQILAAPTLIKEDPLPRKLLVGDMSDRSRVLKGLGLN